MIQSRYRTILSPRRALTLPFSNHTMSLPCLFPSPIAPFSLQTPLILSCISIALSLQECYRNEPIQYVSFWDLHFSHSSKFSCLLYKLITVLIAFIYYRVVFFRRRQWHPTPVLLPGESHGWRSLEGCSPWGR